MKLFKILLIMVGLSLVFSPRAYAQDNEDSETDGALELVYESLDMEEFTQLEIDVVNTEIEIVSGDKYGLQIYLSQADIKVEDVFNIKDQDGIVTIDEKDWKNNLESLINNIKSHIVVTVPKVNELSAKIEFVNGDIKVPESLKKLYLDIVNGDILLAGHESYPVEIELVNGDIELFFDKYDANFVLEFVNGDIDIMGDKISARLSEYRKTVGDGKHDIRIDAVNGSVIISGRAR